MTEKDTLHQSRVEQRWEYKQVVAKAETYGFLQFGVERGVKAAGEEGWEAFSVVAIGDSLVYFMKRPVTIDPPPDPGRALRKAPAPIDPPPDPG
ncbi:hypothetical protein WMF30_10475 [Sorangium sp. So ce134]